MAISSPPAAGLPTDSLLGPRNCASRSRVKTSDTMNVTQGTPRGFDFTPALFAILFAFVAVGAFEFFGSWPTAHHGLLMFEKACPIYSHSLSRA